MTSGTKTRRDAGRMSGGLPCVLRTLAVGVLLFACVVPVFAQEAAHQQFLFAYKLLQRNEDAQAIRAFDEFLARYPDDEKRADALYYRALLSQRAGDNAAAAQFLRNIGEPKHVPAYAIALLRGQVNTALQQYDRALAALEQINVRDLPDDKLRASVLQLRGGAYRAVGNTNAAVEAFRQAAELDSPLKGAALLDLGRTCVLMGDRQQAIDAFRKAIDANDPSIAAEAARLAGDQSYALQEYADAIAFYSIVITGHQTSPHFSPSVLGMMWAMYAAERYEPLLQAYDQYRGMLSEEDRIAAAYLAGAAQQELGRHPLAIGTFTAVLDAARGSRYHAQLLYKLALSQFEIQQYDAMSRTLRTLFETHPDSPLNMDGQFLLAATEARRGNPTGGIERLTAIINHEPKHPYHDQALLQRAQLYEQAQKYEEAIEDYVRYLALPGRITPEGAFVEHDPVLRVCDLHYRMGRYDAVLTTLDRLLASKPDARVEAEALYRQAHARIKLNQHAPAVASLTQLLDKHPQSSLVAQARYYRGLLRVGLGHAEEGLADLLAAADAQQLPDTLRANALRLAAVSQREQADPQPAVDTLMRLRQLSGLTADEMLWLGRHFVTTNQTTTAIAYLEPLTDPSRSVPAAIRGEALLQLGNAYRKAGSTDRAIAAFERVLRDHPPFQPHARLALAQTLRAAGRADEALTQYARLTSSQVSRVAAEALFDTGAIHRERADRLRRTDDRSGAAQALQQSYDSFKRLVVLYPFAELSPLPELAFIELSEIAVLQGDAAAGRSALQELVDKFADGPFAEYARAVLAQGQGKRSEAAFLLRRLHERRNELDARLTQRVTALLNELEDTP